MPYIYKVNRAGVMLRADDPGGTCMEVGATACNGQDLKPITMIDYVNKQFCRAGWGDRAQPFPEHWYEDNLVWTPVGDVEDHAVGQG